MKNIKELSSSNLLKLLKNFSKEELIEFEKYVSSPLYNSQGTLVRLLGELKLHYPEFSGEDFTKEILFSKVNPGKKYNDDIFRKYMSNLFKLAEGYLVYLENKTAWDRQTINLLDQFDKRNLNGFYDKHLDQAENNSELSRIISNESFYFKHLREELKAMHNIRTNHIHLTKPELIRSQIYLLLHLLLTGTVYNNMMLVNSKSFKNDEDNDFFKNLFRSLDIINFLEQQKLLKEEEKWFVELCKYDNLLMNDPYNQDYLKLMNDYLLKLIPNFNKNLLYAFFSHLNIYYLLNISKGTEIYKKKLFENYKLMIFNELYVNEDREFINFSEYKTILNSAVRLGEYEWAGEFIEKFKNYHSPENRDNIIHYSKACLNFETGDYESSLKFLSSLSADNVMMQLDKNILQMMIYFELNYFDSALSLVDSFRHYLKSNRILSTEVIDYHCNFIRYYKIILRNKQNSVSRFDFDFIKNEITENKNMRRKEWLLKKLDETVSQKYSAI